MRKKRDTAQALVDDLRKRIIDTTSERWETATAELELESSVQALDKAQKRMENKEKAMGAEKRHLLRTLIKSPFLTKKMNARALKIRIRERLIHSNILDLITRYSVKQNSTLMSSLKTLSNIEIQGSLNLRNGTTSSTMT